MSELQALPPALASKQRLDIESAFAELAKPYPGQENAPYHTRYLTIRSKASQTPDGVREFLRKHLPSHLSWTEEERNERRSDYRDRKPPDIYSPFLDRLARFIIGTAGGCSLIVPMVVMVFHPSLPKSLITVSVSVMLFALALGLIFETNNKDTVTATAIYAAVLVVFVGTSITGS
jgi:hypothetical protein